jgi:hypothetical protein
VTGSVGWVFLLGLAAVVAFGAYGLVRDRRRRRELLAFCSAKGWAYVSENPAFVDRWRGTPFGEGTSRRARDVVTGVDRGRPVACFAYSYVTESTDAKGNRQETTHRFSIVSLALPVWLPGLEVVPDTLLRRAAESLGLGAGVELESEDFNRRFTVTAHQSKFASDVLTPRTMEALLALPDTSWRVEGSDILSWEAGAVTPVQLLSRLAVLHAVVDGIPGFVWRDNGLPPSAPTARDNDRDRNTDLGADPTPPAEGSAP